MDQDLKNLIESPEFQQYHKALQTPPFNPFDVLRYADYEIRHSNVLAWLLDPGGNHGTGDSVLKEFLQCLSHVASKPGLDSANVRIERELDRVDITIFFKAEQLLIAIENKTEALVSEHVEQAMGYHGKLLERYRGRYDIRSVLLTPSRSDGGLIGNDAELVHVSWLQVHEIVSSLLLGPRFPSSEVRTFIGHYLKVIDRITSPPVTETDYFGKLLDEHGPALHRLAEKREEDAGIVDQEPFGTHATYKNPVDRLLRDFRQEPRRLRSDVRTFLEDAGRGFRTWTNDQSRHSTYYLYFTNAAMDMATRALGVYGSFQWAIIFSRREVFVQLQFCNLDKNTKPVVDRITEFMRGTPVESSGLGKVRYPMEIPWAGCFHVYKHCLFTDEDLSDMSTSTIRRQALQKMKRFLDGDENRVGDYRRIEDYFKCLAFDPRSPEPRDTEHSTGE